MDETGIDIAEPPVPAPRWKTFVWPDWEQRKRLLRTEMWIGIGLCWVVLFGSRLVPLATPGAPLLNEIVCYAAFMVRVFEFHIGLALLVVCAVALARRKWTMAAAALIPAAICCMPAARGHIGAAPHPGHGAPLRIAFANLHEENSRQPELVAEVKAAQPDLILFVEYTTDWDAQIREMLAAGYPHSCIEPSEDAWGLAVFSRHPFREKPRTVPAGDGFVPHKRMAVDIDGRPAVVYLVHVYPPRGPSHYTDQCWQLRDLVAAASRETSATVIAGDFNAPDNTPVDLHVRRAGYRGCHTIAGKGRCATWPRKPAWLAMLPGLRLDHVYLDRELTCRKTWTGRAFGSDHSPVFADVAWAQPLEEGTR